MITVLGSARRACTGPTRREALKAGALSLLGGLFNSPSLQAVEKSPSPDRHPARAKSVVLIYLQGGPPTQDMFDLKPRAPDGVGGEFKPIATTAPGVEVGELLPQTARWMHRSAIIRSVYHNGGCHKNLPMYTGLTVNDRKSRFIRGILALRLHSGKPMKIEVRDLRIRELPKRRP